MRRRKEGLDRLDAALDGRLVEVDDELAPLVEGMVDHGCAAIKKTLELSVHA